MHFDRKFLQDLLEECHGGKKCNEEAKDNDMCIEVPESIKNQEYKIDAYKIEECIKRSKTKTNDGNEFKKADCLFLIKKANIDADTAKSQNASSLALLVEMKTSSGRPVYDNKGNRTGERIKKACKQLEHTSLWIQENEKKQSTESEVSKDDKDTRMYPIIVVKRFPAWLQGIKKELRLINILGKKHFVHIEPYSGTKKDDFWTKRFSTS